MRLKVRTKDWLQLSAYIDGELGTREKEKLEKRLKEDAQLLSELNQLKITRSMIRSLPRHKIPRNFTVTTQMIAARPRNNWLPVFSYASAVSAVIVMVLLLVQFLPGFGLRGSQNAAPQLAMSAEMESQESAPAENPEVIFWGGVEPPVMIQGKGGGSSEEVTAFSEAPVQAYGMGGAPDTALESAPYMAEPAAPLAEEMPFAESAPLDQAPLDETAVTGEAEAEMESPDAQATASADNSATQRQDVPPAESAAPAEGEAQALSPDTADQTATKTGDEQPADSSPILGIRPSEEANRLTIAPDSVAGTGSALAGRGLSALPDWLLFTFLGLTAAFGLTALILWRKGR